jgi:hypothetical protein
MNYWYIEVEKYDQSLHKSTDRMCFVIGADRDSLNRDEAGRFVADALMDAGLLSSAEIVKPENAARIDGIPDHIVSKPATYTYSDAKMWFVRGVSGAE